MSLSALVNGTECGPSNPLQGLSKRFDQDRGIQQDQFVAGRAGPSRQTFRTQNASSEVDQDARRFFSGPQPPQHAAPFDLNPLAYALPVPSPVEVQTHPAQSCASPAPWAADFMLQQQAQPHQGGQTLSPAPIIEPSTSSLAPIQAQPGVLPQAAFSPGYLGYRVGPPVQAPVAPVQSPPVQAALAIDWEKAFQEHLAPAAQQVAEKEKPKVDTDLARAAGMLIEQVKDETNPKFKNSEFMRLMHGIRDGEVVVSGNDMVSASETSTSSTTQPSVDLKGKGKMVERPVRDHFVDYLAATQDEMDNDWYFKQDNEEYIQHHNHLYSARPPTSHDAITNDWSVLHDQWERFEAQDEAIKAVPNYQFQTNNPYLYRDVPNTRTHAIHSYESDLMYDGVLEREAAVQKDPRNAQAWFELGVKQQENEREGKAMQALERAVDLDPDHLPSWLALAVSYTNDNNRREAYRAIHEWVTRVSQDVYAPAIADYRAKAGNSEKQSDLIDCLISMARLSVGENLDADIQIALAVLLNCNEDYGKAHDCFRAALAVRPEDWLLYNRVGATLANSGRPEEALQYYAKALELKPNYIRARFNLGISCINLRRYEEAAQHIVVALGLQDNDQMPDSSGMNEKRGVVSKTLWDSLKTACLHMQRIDLANLCDRQDLDGLRTGLYEMGMM